MDEQEITTTVRGGFGFYNYAELELTKDETLSEIESRYGVWVYADGCPVTPEELTQADWNTVGTITIIPALVGGAGVIQNTD